MTHEPADNDALMESYIYQIRLKGQLGSQWTNWFGGLVITAEPDGTTLLTGPIIDQSELFGILRKVRDCGIPLLSVICLDSHELDNR